ncbi:hypothetical protein IJU97_04075 [bacterium]|nr:hypothetical protein [bacterium]
MHCLVLLNIYINYLIEVTVNVHTAGEIVHTGLASSSTCSIPSTLKTFVTTASESVS